MKAQATHAHTKQTNAKKLNANQMALRNLIIAHVNWNTCFSIAIVLPYIVAMDLGSSSFIITFLIAGEFPTSIFPL